MLEAPTQIRSPAGAEEILTLTAVQAVVVPHMVAMVEMPLLEIRRQATKAETVAMPWHHQMQAPQMLAGAVTEAEAEAGLRSAVITGTICILITTQKAAKEAKVPRAAKVAKGLSSRITIRNHRRYIWQ